MSNYNNGDKKDVDVFINNQMNQVIEYNHKIMIPIIKTILFCAQNNLPLRGHRESDSLKCYDIKKSVYRVNKVYFVPYYPFILRQGLQILKLILTLQLKTAL